MAYTTIDDPSEYFTTTLYTGNATARSITNSANAGNFQPDWLWIKVRNNANNHRMFDSSRGHAEDLKPNLTEGGEDSTDRCTGFDSNGFSLGNNAEVNSNTHNIVAWQWKANGGTTTSVSASGSGATQIVASTHQANTEAGFSIVTFTAPSIGSGNDFTVSHGLGAVPEVIILKRRDGTGNWHVYHKGTGNLGATFLNLTNAFADAEYFGDTTPTSTVFSQSEGSASDPGHTQIAFCFRSIKGYSKYGSYIGNGTGANSAADGTFVYTGFKPAWVMVKATTVAQGWNIFDNKRTPTNEMGAFLFADTADAETTGYDSMDFLSNGFKLRKNLNGANDSGQTFIYIAFAESPLVSSNGVPTTAR